MTRPAVRLLGTRRDRRARLLVATLIVLAVAIATPVAPAAAATTGELSGSVSSAVTGGALAGAYVDVYSLSSGGYVGFADTDHNGNYTVTGLAPGSYKVELSAGGYLAQYYNGESTQGAADPVSVTAGQNTTGVDATMRVSGAISGHVTDSVTGGPAGGVQIVAYNAGNQVVAQTTADAGGAYTLTGLVTGSYDVEFEPVGSQPYLPQYYSGAATPSSATSVSVTDGKTTSGIDAAMATGSGIDGTVSSGGQPAAGVSVWVFNSSGSAAGYGSTDATGAYTVTGVTPGTYTVEFLPPTASGVNAAPQYYNGKTTAASADPVTVAGGHFATVSTDLPTGGQITGAVTDASTHAALPGVEVYAYSSSGGYSGYGYTDANGNYTISSLATGTYQVSFYPYDNSHLGSGQSGVSVTAGSVTSGINAALATGGTIAGTITDAVSGHVVGGVEVEAISSGGGSSGYHVSASDGTYRIGGLSAGSYKVEFVPYTSSNSAYTTQYYNGVTSLASATSVSVSLGQTTSGINAALAATGGTIAGTITDAVSGHVVGGVEVEAISSGGGSSGYHVSASDGTYRIGGLSAGSYKVEFVPYTSSNSAYTTQYYNGVTSLASATSVSVSLGQTTSGINATLSGGGSVSGTVDGGSSATPLSGVSVYLYSTSYQYYGTATTDANGGFFFGGIPAGLAYIAYFNSPSSAYTSEYYGGTTNGSSATSFTVTAGQATTGINQTLPAYGAVSGTVTDASTQAGVAGITVAVLNSYGGQVASAVTGTGGAYTVVGVSSGTYTVQFAPIGTGGDYLPTSRTGVSVTNGATTSGINQALPAGGTVTGTVTDATSGTGLAGVAVTLYNSYQQYLASTTTSAGGTYSLPGLPTGTYEVGFSYGSYVSTYYGGSRSLGSATRISVTAGQTTGSISQALPRAGQIAGRVTDAASGVAIAKVQVQLYDSSGSVIASTQTGTTGDYSLTGVLPGTYTASFTPGDSTSTFMSQWYRGATTSAGATSFAVTAGQTTRGIDASLGRGGIVSGTVTAATNGADLAGITVTVYSSNGTSLGSTATRPDGTYALGGIPTGSYTVGFAPPTGGTLNYLPQYYANAASTSSATSVAVTAGQTTTGINAALQSGGQITGVVTDAATGKPVQNAYVALITGSYYFHASTLTDANGDYTFSGLPSGSYQVAFSIGDGDYLAQNYNGQNSYRSYTNVTVAQGSTTAGIDAALGAPAEIQGTVTDSITGNPISGVTVSTSGPNGTIQTTTGSDGTYSLTGLYPGSYTVYFKPPSGANYLSQYYKGAATSSGATPVSVGDGADVTGINASLQTGGQISGTVTSQATATAISGLWVYVLNSSGNSVGSAQTSANGAYTVTNLPTGNYEVEFYGTGSYIPQYYNNQTSYANANPVSVTAGQATTGINAAMLSNGMISGTVTDHSTGNPIAGAYVYVYNSNGYYITSATTNSSGVYTTPGLPAGSYTVKFSATGYAPFTYSGTVSVSIGTTTSGINAALTPDGAISGTVTNASGQTNLASVSVTAYDSSGSYVTSTSTASDGSYTLKNLVPGTYELEFTPPSGQNYLPQYYHGKSTLASADPVTVTSGQTTTGIGAALATGGQITGKVTDSATGQPVQYAYAELLNASGGYVSEVSTAADGTFTLTALPTGTYILYFSASGHLAQYYNNESSLSSADKISVTAGSATSGINAALVPYGSITGTVTDAKTGHALQYVEVYAYNTSGQVVATGSTSSSGAYTLSNLSPATYALYFYDYNSSTGYVAQYYNDQSTLAAANGVTVNPGATTSAINVGLVPEGAITGTVTDGSTHEAIPGVQVHVYGSTGTLVGSGTSSSTGQYTVGNLQPGTYRVGFYGQDSASQSVTQYYNQEATLAAADSVTVTAGATTSAINSQLDSVPSNLSAPTITGTAAQGSTLSEHNGSWTFSPTSYAYQWERCGQSTCAAIPGATGQTYVPTNADVGDTIEVQETATNLAGTSAAVTSTATAAVVGEPPANTTPPSISGTAQQGQTLTEVPGVWTNQPSTVHVQWLQCANGTCSPITGATGSTYVPTANDVGDTIEVQETATNDTGPGTPAVSSPTATVLIPAPVNTAVPTISGTAQEGQTLTEAHGTWSGGATSYTYQWERCDSSGANCQGIHGADASGYSPTAEDIGDTIEVWETAWNAGGASKVAMSAPTAPVTLPPLAASAGDPVTGSVGVPLTLDGSGSIPASAITGYHWDFGDGTSGAGETARHTYSATGKFAATLTVSVGSSTATSSVSVTVGPHASGVTISVEDPNGQPISGADVVYMAPDGSRINATADGNGVATLTGLPDGADNVYAWAQGYQVATATVTASGGTGSVTVHLVPGQVASATLTSTPLTLSQIQAAGIDTSDPANQNVYQFHVGLKFPPSYDGGGGGGGAGGGPDLCGYVNSNGQFVGSTGPCGGGGGTCTDAMCFGPGWTAVPIMVNGKPMIEWLTIAGQVSVLKQFFAVDMVIQNLAGSPVELDNGSATLNLPDGLTLAPTASPQSATQSVGTIAAGQSAAVEWIVRGDTPGSYYFSADYHGTLQPFNQPITISAGLHDPLVVYGADALKLSVQADSGSMVVGQPYHVRLAVTNTAPVPFYNVGLSTPDQATNFIFQPLQTFSSSVSTLNPGQTLYSPWFILVPALPSAGNFDPSGSYASFVGQRITPGTGITAVAPPKLYQMSALEDAGGEIHLHWEAVPGAEGYEVFETRNLETAFPASPEEVGSVAHALTRVTELPQAATDAYISGSGGWFYAVSAVINGHPILEAPVIQAAPEDEHESNYESRPWPAAGFGYSFRNKGMDKFVEQSRLPTPSPAAPSVMADLGQVFSDWNPSSMLGAVVPGIIGLTRGWTLFEKMWNAMEGGVCYGLALSAGRFDAELEPLYSPPDGRTAVPWQLAGTGPSATELLPEPSETAPASPAFDEEFLGLLTNDFLSQVSTEVLASRDAQEEAYASPANGEAALAEQVDSVLTSGIDKYAVSPNTQSTAGTRFAVLGIGTHEPIAGKPGDYPISHAILIYGSETLANGALKLDVWDNELPHKHYSIVVEPDGTWTSNAPYPTVDGIHPFGSEYSLREGTSYPLGRLYVLPLYEPRGLHLFTYLNTSGAVLDVSRGTKVVAATEAGGVPAHVMDLAAGVTEYDGASVEIKADAGEVQVEGVEPEVDVRGHNLYMTAAANAATGPMTVKEEADSGTIEATGDPAILSVARSDTRIVGNGVVKLQLAEDGSVSAVAGVEGEPKLRVVFTHEGAVEERSLYSRPTAPGEPIQLTSEQVQAIIAGLKRPEVNVQPAGMTVNAGEPAVFTAEAQGDPAPSVQWEVSRDGGAFVEVPGATSDTLAIASTELGESGDRYEAVFKNAFGETTSSAATLTVNPAAASEPAGGGTGGAGSGGISGTSTGSGAQGSSGVAGFSSTKSPQFSLAGAMTSKSGAVLVPLRCPAGASSCATGTVKLTIIEELSNGRLMALTAKHKAKVTKHTIVIGELNLTISAGETKTFKVSLNRAGKTLMSTHSKLVVKVQVLTEGTTIATQRVTVTRRARKH